MVQQTHHPGSLVAEFRRCWLFLRKRIYQDKGGLGLGDNKKRGASGMGVRTGDNGVATPAELLRAQGQNHVLRGRLKDILGSSLPETISNDLDSQASL